MKYYNQPFSDLLEQGIDNILEDFVGGKGGGGASHWPTTKVERGGAGFDSLGQNLHVFDALSLIYCISCYHGFGDTSFFDLPSSLLFIKILKLL